MRQFFSQTWVACLLITATLAVVCYIAFKKDKEEDAAPQEEAGAEQE